MYICQLADQIVPQLRNLLGIYDREIAVEEAATEKQREMLATLAQINPASGILEHGIHKFARSRCRV